MFDGQAGLLVVVREIFRPFTETDIGYHAHIFERAFQFKDIIFNSNELCVLVKLVLPLCALIEIVFIIDISGAGDLEAWGQQA